MFKNYIYNGIEYSVRYDYEEELWLVSCPEFGWCDKKINCGYRLQDIMTLVSCMIHIVLMEKHYSTIGKWIAGSLVFGIFGFVSLVFAFGLLVFG